MDKTISFNDAGAPVVVRAVLRAIKEEDRAVITSATGCLEVSTFMYPYTAWEDSFFHSAFENGACNAAGIEAAYNNMKRTVEAGRIVSLTSNPFVCAKGFFIFLIC